MNGSGKMKHTRLLIVMEMRSVSVRAALIVDILVARIANRWFMKMTSRLPMTSTAMNTTLAPAVLTTTRDVMTVTCGSVLEYWRWPLP